VTRGRNIGRLCDSGLSPYFAVAAVVASLLGVASSAFGAQSVYFQNLTSDYLKWSGSSSCTPSNVLRIRATWAGVNYVGAGVPSMTTGPAESYTAGTLYVYITPHGSGEYVYGTYTIGSSGSQTITITGDLGCTPSSDPSTNECLMTWTIKNNDVYRHHFTAFKNGVEDLSKGFLDVSPGGSGVFSFYTPCTNASGWTVAFSQQELDTGFRLDTPLANPGIATNTSTPTFPSSTNGTFGATVGAYGGAGAGTNIQWRAGDSTNAIASQQFGDSALLDAVNKLRVETGLNFTNLASVTARATNASTDLSPLTNVLGQLKDTNAAGFGDLGATLKGMSNIYNSFTNSSFAAGVTNAWGNASNLAAAASSPLTGPLGIFTDTISDLDQPAFSGVDSAFWTVSFAERSWNFNPYHYFPDLFDFCRRLIAWCLLVAYLTRVISDAWGFARLIASAQQSSVMSIEGFTTNIWTLGILPVFIVLMLSAIAVLIAGVAAALATWITGDNLSMFTTLPWVSGSAGVLAGVQLLSAAVPLNLVVSFTVSYIVWRCTMVGVGVLFAVWVKMLVKN